MTNFTETIAFLATGSPLPSLTTLVVVSVTVRGVGLRVTVGAFFSEPPLTDVWSRALDADVSPLSSVDPPQAPSARRAVSPTEVMARKRRVCTVTTLGFGGKAASTITAAPVDPDSARPSGRAGGVTRPAAAPSQGFSVTEHAPSAQPVIDRSPRGAS